MLKELPTQFWAICLAGMGATIAVVFYVIPADVTTRQAAFQIASALVTGALGAFAGQHLGASNTTTATGPNPVINNTPSPLVPPVDPAQPLK